MIKNLQNKLKFIELIDKMKDIDRAIYLKNWKQENDAEHSYHLAMMTIVFSEDFPELNLEKCIKFALIHDLVEIYAWDTIAVIDLEWLKTKEKREKDAINRLEKEFWNILWNILDLIKEYESKASKEARFVYSLDKIHPIIQNVIVKWKGWRKWNYNLEKTKENQYSKVYSEFWLEKVLDIYFEKAEKENMFYNEK